MQTEFPYTLYYNIIPISTIYRTASDDNENATEQDITLYLIELPFTNLKCNISSFIYCNLYFNSTKDTSYIKDKIKSYVNISEQLSELNDVQNIVDFVNINNEVFGTEIWLLKSLNDNVLHNQNENLFINDSLVRKEISAMSNDELYNKNIFHFVNLNKHIISEIQSKENNMFSDEQLASFTSTFFNIINKHYNETLDNSENNASSATDKIYDSVMNYYMSMKEDTVSVGLDLILSSMYKSVKNSYDSVESSCGCSSNSNNDFNMQESCYSLYKTAMTNWLTQMMSDIDNFYNKYFKVININDDGKECYNINIDLVNDLIELITEFKNVGYDLSFEDNSPLKFRNCNCDNDNYSSTASDCNYKILDDFLAVLNIIKNDEIESNYNKIKLVGKEIAGLLDKMYF